MDAFHTPLRYPGGKGRLGPWLAYTMRSNGIGGGTYVEPYAGGAGAAIYLLRNEYVKHVVLNDVDPCIYYFWVAVLKHTEKLIDLIKSTPITLQSWYKQREILDDDNAGQIERGFATFFLNRTNRSGILHGGVIGGKQQDNKYRLDARYRKEALIKRVEKIARLRSRIELYNLDALDFINYKVKDLPKRSLTYFDPPYFQKGKQLYRNYYGPEDHALVASEVLQVSSPWIVTYDNADEISSLYKNCSRCTYRLQYSSTSARSAATEQMFWHGLQLPKTPILSRMASAYPKAWDAK